MTTHDISASRMGDVQRPAPAAAAPLLLGRRPGLSPRTDRIWTLPGFCGDARVTTSFGDLPVKALRRNDPLRLAQGSLAIVEWVDHIHLEEALLHFHPDAQPVLIQAGALGPGRPAADLLVSPHQKINVGAGPYSQDFRRARDLTGRPGVMRRPETVLSYHLFHCGAPAVVCVNGVLVPVTP
ncbi:MAG: hypothetical protein CVT84_14300 [Alphaproteobacteria bacterium HGW-Alphaproteobacteria-6]|nr:MAG: hypothetical protein CVT84_14300 [Alphaproteobacteria bacterium HGW-Alphaproteobacteria-6]